MGTYRGSSHMKPGIHMPYITHMYMYQDIHHTCVYMYMLRRWPLVNCT